MNQVEHKICLKFVRWCCFVFCVLFSFIFFNTEQTENYNVACWSKPIIMHNNKNYVSMPSSTNNQATQQNSSKTIMKSYTLSMSIQCKQNRSRWLVREKKTKYAKQGTNENDCTHAFYKWRWWDGIIVIVSVKFIFFVYERF